MNRARYGIDAPRVITGFMVLGGLSLTAGIAAESIGVSRGLVRLLRPAAWIGGTFFVQGALMLLYALAGKFHHRDRMLGEVAWTGAEHVLDVGTGRGLLMIGAARRLTTGRAVGIDIFRSKDLSGNAVENTRRNIALEGVAGRAEVRHEDVRTLSFADASFDVVLSNLCLHNIEEADGRRKACREIARVLAPGGVALISDFQKTSDYVETFREEAWTCAGRRRSSVPRFRP